MKLNDVPKASVEMWVFTQWFWKQKKQHLIRPTKNFQLPSGTIVAHKTGTAATYSGLTRATNDAGIISLPNGKHLAICVFISDSYAGPEERDLVIAKISKSAFDHWGME